MSAAQGQDFVWFYLMAMFLCVVADIVICFRFKVGIIFFGLAHLVFILSFIIYGASAVVAIPLFITLLAFMFYLAKRWQLTTMESSKYLTYFVVLSAMVALSVSRGWGVLLGASTFAISDVILVYNRYVAKKSVIGRINGWVYFLALFLLAIA